MSIVLSSSLMAMNRNIHEHDDFINEQEIQFGMLLGTQITNYTNIQEKGFSLPIQSKARFLLGPTLRLIYSLPRVEVNFLWSTRGGARNSGTYSALSIPLLIKVPKEIFENTDLEVGVGFQPDFTFLGPTPRRPIYYGGLASVGIAHDLISCIFNFESRYNYGFYNLHPDVDGGKISDIQILSSLLWHF